MFDLKGLGLRRILMGFGRKVKPKILGKNFIFLFV